MCRLLIILFFASLASGACEAVEVTREARFQAATRRGVLWLLSQQQADGSFGGAGQPAHVVHTGAMTALAVLALHEAGHRASDASDEGSALVKAAAYLCKDYATDPALKLPGRYLGRKDASRMYGQGMITFALATVTPEIPDPALQKTVRTCVLDAVTYILASQNTRKRPADDGGWRYEGISMDSDISCTVWQLLALRAAVEYAGASVPEDAWSRAASFVKRLSRSPDKQPGEARAMSYEFLDSRMDLATTGAGVRALQCCGEPHAPEADACRLFLDKSGLSVSADRWLFWSASHCSHAMLDGNEEQKARFVARLASVLLPKQKADGSWHQDKGVEKQAGDVFVTALAVSALAPWMGKE